MYIVLLFLLHSSCTKDQGAESKHQRANPKKDHQYPNPWLATYPNVLWSMILNNSRQKNNHFHPISACHPSLDLNMCPKNRHGCRPFFVKPPHKESKLWSDASVSVSQANKIFFVVLNLSQGRESWVDLVDTFFTQCKYDSHKMTRNTWKNHCSTMTPYLFNDLVWTKYVVHLQLE